MLVKGMGFLMNCFWNLVTLGMLTDRVGHYNVRGKKLIIRSYIYR